MANGAELTDGASFDGAVLLVFRGVNLPDAGIEVYKAGVYYTPLASSAESYSYTIGDNGVYTVLIDGLLYARFTVEGVEVPSYFPRNMRALQTDIRQADPAADHIFNVMELGSANCINYPYVASEELPYFVVRMYGSLPEGTSIGFINCRANQATTTGSWPRWNLSVIDPSAPAVLTFNGFIFAVLNYQQQRRRRR